MSARVVELDTDDARWQSYVEGHPEGLVYHHPAWIRTLRAAYGYEPVVLGLETEDHGLVGVLPLMRRRGLFTGRRLASLPHTPVCGPLGSDAAAVRALAEAAARTATERGTGLELKCDGPLEPAAASLDGGPWSTSYSLMLPTDTSEIRFGNSRNHGRIKWAVNKAARSGVTVRDAANEDELARWHRLYLETMRWHVVPPRPYGFFRAAWEILRPAGLMRLLLAERSDAAGSRIIAGAMLFTGSSTVLYAYNGRAASELAARPNDVLQWHAIHEAVAAGARRYDFGEVEEDQQGLTEFKTKWGAQPVTLHRYTLHDGKGGAGRSGQSGGRARRLGGQVWRRLPLSVTARIGAVLYRRV
jgi:CelD/BcsL family acetyltransferase involved in cellulose biosynthesis